MDPGINWIALWAGTATKHQAQGRKIHCRLVDEFFFCN
jgi:hypothetical protein